MSKKCSVYLTDRTLNVFGSLPDDEKLSGRLNAVVDRYGDLIARARRKVLPRFDQPELKILHTVALVWDTRKTIAGMLIGALADEVQDYCMRTGGSAVAVPGAASLLAKLAELDPTEEMALIEWVENEAFRGSSVQRGDHHA